MNDLDNKDEQQQEEDVEEEEEEKNKTKTRDTDRDETEKKYNSATYKENNIETEKKEKDTTKLGKKNKILNVEGANIFKSEVDNSNNTYKIKKVSRKNGLKNLTIAQHSLLCNELKQLYVAITRPKNRLIIYDDNNLKRARIESYWKNLGLVQVVSSKLLDNIEDKGDINLDLVYSSLI